MTAAKLSALLLVTGCLAVPQPSPPAASVPGGVIDLQTNEAEAKADARRRIADRCGGNNFMILLEGFDYNASAWRIYYQCNVGAGP